MEDSFSFLKKINEEFFKDDSFFNTPSLVKDFLEFPSILELTSNTSFKKKRKKKKRKRKEENEEQKEKEKEKKVEEEEIEKPRKKRKLFHQYLVQSDKFSNIKGVKRGVSETQYGNSDENIEKHTLKKSIGDKSFTLEKTKKNGKEEVKKFYENLNSNEEKKFLNDWKQFPLSVTSTQKKDVKKQIEEKKADQEKDKTLGFSQISTTSPDGTVREIKTKKKREGQKQFHTITKQLGNKKLKVTKIIDENGKEIVVKKYDNLKEDEENEFLSKWKQYEKSLKDEK